MIGGKEERELHKNDVRDDFSKKGRGQFLLSAPVKCAYAQPGGFIVKEWNLFRNLAWQLALRSAGSPVRTHLDSVTFRGRPSHRYQR